MSIAVSVTLLHMTANRSSAALPVADAEAADPILPSKTPGDDLSQEVVVNGYPPHCRQLAGDPLDIIDTTLRPGEPDQRVILYNATTGVPEVVTDQYPVTGPIFWQRVGTRLSDYRFRVPADGTPLCIGSLRAYPGGIAQLRRAVDARHYRGKVVRFTAFIATRRAAGVSFWLAAGVDVFRKGKKVAWASHIVAGDNSDKRPIAGNHGWTPISYTIGPIPHCASQISYGVSLNGGGDLWLYQPNFEVVAKEQLPRGVYRGNEDHVCGRTRGIFDPR